MVREAQMNLGRSCDTRFCARGTLHVLGPRLMACSTSYTCLLTPLRSGLGDDEWWVVQFGVASSAAPDVVQLRYDRDHLMTRPSNRAEWSRISSHLGPICRATLSHRAQAAHRMEAVGKWMCDTVRAARPPQLTMRFSCVHHTHGTDVQVLRVEEGAYLPTISFLRLFRIHHLRGADIQALRAEQRAIGLRPAYLLVLL